MDMITLLFVLYLILRVLRARADYVLIATVWIILLDVSHRFDTLTIASGSIISLLIYGCCKLMDSAKASVKSWMRNY